MKFYPYRTTNHLTIQQTSLLQIRVFQDDDLQKKRWSLLKKDDYSQYNNTLMTASLKVRDEKHPYNDYSIHRLDLCVH